MINNFDVVLTFCFIDDFCQQFEPNWHKTLIEQKTKIGPKTRMHLSEILCILVWFHLSGARCFKHFYLGILLYNKSAFPGLVSYTRFVELMPMTLIPLIALFNVCKGQKGGISFMDSTPMPVCSNKRIYSHRVFKNSGVQRGKSTMGWFFGFKLHIVINEKGEIISMMVTPGNVNDRKVVPDLTKELFGKIFADKGYLSESLFKLLYKRGLKLVTHIKNNMKQKLIDIQEKILLRKRSIIESTNHLLKDVCYIDHTRHRSPINFLVNLISGICAYCFHQNKPKLRMSDFKMLPDLI